MKRIDSVIYWFGGVLAPPLAHVAGLVATHRPWNGLDADLRTELVRSADDLTLGLISAEHFCQRVIDCSGVSLGVDEFSARVQTQTMVAPDVLSVIAQLPERYERWLVCDYPGDWLHPIAQRSRLWEVVSEEHCLRPAEWGMSRLLPDVFYNISAHTNQAVDRCLLIDASTPRAVAAVRHQFSSTIYVDARRLARDYVLRNMMERDAG